MTTYPVGEHPGAVWKKADLQGHTPRDPQWKGGPHIAGGTPENDKARREWAAGFIAACKEKGLSLVAITDHHDIAFVGVVQQLLDADTSTDALWFLPGMEVTCTDSVQCLALFNPETKEITLQRFFGKLTSVAVPDANTELAPQALPCGNSIEDVVGAIHEDEILRECTIIVPNATSKGHKAILRIGFHPRFAKLRVDGFYCDGPITKMEDGDLRVIRGEIKEWGTRRRALVTTGDNRQADFSDLGVHGCWIRLGEPTVEALRQAFLADEARISYIPPNAPSQFLLRLAISSTLCGSNFAIRLNDGYNTLIGGRGSGKSAILEYLRFGIGRSALDIDSSLEEPSRAQKLLLDTLQGGFVSVSMERQGVREVWTRTLKDRERIKVEISGKGDEYIPIAVAQERFRARGFHQKQLSTIVASERSAADQITGIAAAELVVQLKEADDNIHIAGRELRTALSQYIGLLEKEAVARNAKSSLEDVGRRLRKLPRQVDSSLLDSAMIFSRYFAGGRLPSESCGRISL